MSTYTVDKMHPVLICRSGSTGLTLYSQRGGDYPLACTSSGALTASSSATRRKVIAVVVKKCKAQVRAFLCGHALLMLEVYRLNVGLVSYVGQCLDASFG
jgi:hypothetical protein